MGVQAHEHDDVEALVAPGQPFEVRRELVRGRSCKVWVNAPSTLADVLTAGMAWGDLPFLVLDEERLSFADHGRAAASFARWLVEVAGLRPGDRLAIAGSNRPSWSVAFWGASAAGAVVVPLNAWWTGEELAYALADSGTTVLVADRTRLGRLAGHLDSGTRVIALDGTGPGSLDEITHPKSTFVLPAVDVDTDDDATIFYTSGTTGRPKGAVGSHRNITSNLMNLLYWGARAKALAEARGETAPPEPDQHGALVTVPLFHATGCHATLVVAMAQGWKLGLLRRFTPEAAVDLLERERLTRLVGVPTTVLDVLEASGGRDLSSVTYVGYGGAPAPPDLLRRLQERLPDAAVGVGYGLTESSANATTNIGEEYLQRPGSVGRSCPVIDVVAVGPAGEALPAGETGELEVAGPIVVRGYWGRPEETAAAFPDGRLRTGDVGRVDADGWVYVSDRIKDVVIRGGENVYCAEVEAVLCEHPDVLAAAVVGVPHDRLGEQVAAVLRLRPGCHWDDERSQSLQQDARLRLAAFKVPSLLRASDVPLPCTATGKVLKDVLRAALIAEMATASVNGVPAMDGAAR